MMNDLWIHLSPSAASVTDIAPNLIGLIRVFTILQSSPPFLASLPHLIGGGEEGGEIEPVVIMSPPQVGWTPVWFPRCW